MNGFNVVNDWNESDEEMEEQEDEQDQEQEQEEFEEVAESEDDSDELDQPIDIEGDIADYVDECPVDINHFDIIKKLGSGAYGTVFLVRKNRGIDIDSIYALKVISKEEVMKVPKTIIHMRAERKALEILRDCPYIQTLYYAFQTGDKLHLVTEYVPGGEMFQQVQKGPQPEHLVQFYIAELIVALEHIHLKGIVYRDIKLENVLLDADGHIRLVDFGLCKKLGERGRSKSFCGTEEYMAPEVIEGIGHNTAADWWALGVLAIELLSTITPFGVNEENNTIMNRITNEEPIMPQDISEKMKDFLTKVLEKEPADRLGGSEASAAALKQHELFDGIDWPKLERKELPSPAEPPTITHPFDTQNFSREFTEQPATYASTEEPPNSFSIFRGYSYIAPELQPTEANNFGGDSTDDNSTDENWNSMARHIISNRDPDSQFHQKYKFATHHPLGTGKSSVCMKCFNTLDNNYYAVKIYKRSDQNDNEIAILQKSSKDEVPGIVLLVEVLTDSKWTYLVMELIDGVNLMDYLSTIPLNGNVLYHAVIAVCDLVKVVHSKLKCTHGRICFKNIYYISESQELRLIGFGSAKPKTGSQDEEIDYWAIGVFIYTILCGHSPFRSGVSVKQIDNNKFDESSKQWSALPQSVKCLIQKLLRNCNSISKNDLKPLKKVHDISFDSSKERLDENKKIVEIRACKLETSPVIKTEMVSETNGNERITNGKMPAEDTVMPIDGSDEDPSQSPNIIPDESHTALNGQVQKTNFKRKSEKAEEIPKKKTKRDNAQSAPGEETKRGLRQRPRVDYAGKVKGAKTIEAVVIKKEPEPPLQNVTNTTRRGRPKKIAKSPTEPPKQRNPAVPQIRTANGTSTVKSLGEQARYNWVYGWRPKKSEKSGHIHLRAFRL